MPELPPQITVELSREFIAASFREATGQLPERESVWDVLSVVLAWEVLRIRSELGLSDA